MDNPYYASEGILALVEQAPYRAYSKKKYDKTIAVVEGKYCLSFFKYGKLSFVYPKLQSILRGTNRNNRENKY